MRFLLIDDDDVTNYINTRIIKNVMTDADITVALNGVDALQAMEAHTRAGQASFDIVFVDISMPEMDGWSLIDTLSSDKYANQQSAHYVMLTSSVFDDDVAKAKTKPLIKQFYSKPLDPARVKETIEFFQSQLS